MHPSLRKTVCRRRQRCEHWRQCTIREDGARLDEAEVRWARDREGEDDRKGRHLALVLVRIFDRSHNQVRSSPAFH